ncbi:MAG: serine hydrolase domain-containing protein [Steroidobacteraceae bacterium]
MKILRRSAAALVVLLLVATLFAWLKPPGLLRVGAGYSAKIVCSNVFLAGRDPAEILRVDVQAPGIALLRLMRVSVDRERGVVRAGFLGFIGDGVAIARPGKGCTVVPDGKLPPAAAGEAARIQPQVESAAPADSLWPDGGAVQTKASIDRILAEDELAGPGARAIVVVDHGRIVAERYAGGFTARTPLLGWSMTKTVTAGLIGMLVLDGKLALDQAGFWPAGPNDGRDRIRLKDLLAMSSGLAFNENYGAVSDVTSMLYLQPDMAAFAREKPLAHPVGAVWSYSSGTALILSRILQDAAGADAGRFAAERLFKPLGMSSATIESDEHGTLVGSSYMYATARDWAKYAQFLLQEGHWQGQALLPSGYVAMMATPVAASGGEYGQGQMWLWGSADAAFGIPPDTFWFSGHDGQSIAVIPSRQLIIVRLGLTPESLRFTPQPLVKAVLEATG